MSNTIFLICVLIYLAPVSKSCHSFNNTVITATDENNFKIRKIITGCLERKVFGDKVITEIFIRQQNVPLFATDSIRHLLHLKKVSIWYSSLEEIQPRAFRNVPELEQVYMNHCNLTELPEGVFNLLPSLIQLRFHNKISSIQRSAFRNLPNLKRFNISHNNLNDWNKEWFSESTELETIDFSYNKIEEISESAFEGYPKLKNIYFNNNDIYKMSRDAFGNLPFIQYLDLRQNNLLVLDSGAFLENTKIKFLHIEANYISLIPHDFFRKVKVSNIAMHGNPFNCCFFEEMIRWLSENYSKVIYSNKACDREDLPVCVVPADVFGNNCSYPIGSTDIARYFKVFINIQPPISSDCYKLGKV